MSRCFPFTPSGYAKTCSSNDALIVSIKLQEERKNSIPDRVKDGKKLKTSSHKKDRIREKKEKSKDRKDNKRDDKEKLHSALQNNEKQKQIHTDKLYKIESFGQDLKGKSSIEVFERSNLTEEHGRPVDAAQNISCSSDSTGNSGKRKRLSSPASSIQGNGNIIRIRLSSQKRDDPSKTQGELRPPSTKSDPSISCAETILKVQKPVHAAAASTSASTLHLASGLDNLRPCENKKVESLAPKEGPSTSGRVESKELKSKKLSSHEKKMLKRESLYNKLFQNLVPPELATELVAEQVDDEDDWLFGKKDEEKPAKRLRGGDESSVTFTGNLPCSASTLHQPRAHFLSDVGVYALPFTVPF
ncbi:hypothetical protein RND81_06G158800 [Saponaria officinalis]|uniref:Uncharacterized protein n=1 Tax=Saponaria officinalis TaxID=3572 RepID=A0AAW1KB84_SAPOF